MAQWKYQSNHGGLMDIGGLLFRKWYYLVLTLIWNDRQFSASLFSIKWFKALNLCRPLLPSPGQQVLLKSRASKMFQDLDSHSILSMLHRLTGLGQLDQDVVLKLLKQRPEISKYHQQFPKNVFKYFHVFFCLSMSVATFFSCFCLNLFGFNH